MAPHAAVSPPVLTGHGLEAGGQVVLGGATLAALHKRVGQAVSVSYGDRADAPFYVPPTSLVIVGTATLPAVGEPQALHTSMGTGAIIASSLPPHAFRKATEQPLATLNGPSDVFVRLRPGASMAAGLASLRHIADVGTKAFEDLPPQYYQGQEVGVLGVQFPAQIENYRSSGAAPDVLASSLALGAWSPWPGPGGLGAAPAARPGPAESAGFYPGPAGVDGDLAVHPRCGHWGGSRLAGGDGPGPVVVGPVRRGIYAVPDAPVPALSLLLVAGAAFVLANAVAAVPGAYAARTPAALVLRAE